MTEVTEISQIEIGDIVRLTKDGKTIAEGAIEFIDITIPFANVILKVNGEDHGFCDVWLIELGPRTPEQLKTKQDRLFQVIQHKNHMDEQESPRRRR